MKYPTVSAAPPVSLLVSTSLEGLGKTSKEHLEKADFSTDVKEKSISDMLALLDSGNTVGHWKAVLALNKPELRVLLDFAIVKIRTSTASASTSNDSSLPVQSTHTDPFDTTNSTGVWTAGDEEFVDAKNLTDDGSSTPPGPSGSSSDSSGNGGDSAPAASGSGSTPAASGSGCGSTPVASGGGDVDSTPGASGSGCGSTPVASGGGDVDSTNHGISNSSDNKGNSGSDGGDWRVATRRRKKGEPKNPLPTRLPICGRAYLSKDCSPEADCRKSYAHPTFCNTKRADDCTVDRCKNWHRVRPTNRKRSGYAPRGKGAPEHKNPAATRMSLEMRDQAHELEIARLKMEHMMFRLERAEGRSYARVAAPKLKTTKTAVRPTVRNKRSTPATVHPPVALPSPLATPSSLATPLPLAAPSPLAAPAMPFDPAKLASLVTLLGEMGLLPGGSNNNNN